MFDTTTHLPFGETALSAFCHIGGTQIVKWQGAAI